MLMGSLSAQDIETINGVIDQARDKLPGWSISCPIVEQWQARQNDIAAKAAWREAHAAMAVT